MFTNIFYALKSVIISRGECAMKTTISPGKLEVICGSMFSGKSEELIRRMRRAQYAKQTTQLFKHASDIRKDVTANHVQTHNGARLAACPADSIQSIESMLWDDAQIIGIDEVQFFGYDIVLLIDKLVAQGKRVIVAGLDLDFRGIPFGCMPTLMALADDVTKLKAVCMKSGKDAHVSQRLIDGEPAKHTDPIIMVGADEAYEARSRSCHEIDKKPLQEYIKKLTEV